MSCPVRLPYHPRSAVDPEEGRQTPAALSYGAMTETRETLEARKRELFDAIRVLERDREDGTIDEGAYRSARDRYEKEAALVAEHLDTVEGVETRPVHRPVRVTWIAAPAVGLVLAAVVLFLL